MTESIEQLRKRLEQAESILAALQEEEVDAVIGKSGVNLLRLREVEQKLRNSEERYRSLFSNMTEGFALHEIITDSEGKPTDYRFLEVNPTFEQLTGLRRDQLVGRCVLEVLPGTESYWIETYGRVALSGEPANFENYSSQLNKWYEVYAYRPAPRQFAVIFSDISERKEAEKQLNQKEKRLNLALDAGGLAPWEANLKTGEVIGSPQLFRLFGLKEQAGMNLREHWGDHCAEEDRPLIQSAIDAAVEANAKYRVQFRIRRADSGDLRWIDAQADVLSDEEGNPTWLIGVCSDITERKQSEEALREAERKYRELVQYAPAGIYEIDFRKNRFTSVNDAMCQILGYSREELLEMDPLVMLDEQDQGRLRARLDRWLKGEEPDQNVEYKVNTKDGRTLDVILEATFTRDGQGRPLGARVVAHDITERKQMEEALRESEQIFRKLADANLVGVGFGDTKGNVTYINDELLRMMGYTREDYEAGRINWAECVAPEYREQLDGWGERLMRDGVLPTYEREFLRPDGGRTRYIGSAALVTPGKDFHVSIAVDITRIRETEEALRESEATLNAVLDTLPVGVVIADAKGRIVRDNAATRELWGVPPETESWEDYGDWVGWWPETGERIKAHEWAMARALRQGEETRGELVQNQRFGSDERRFYLNNVAPLRDAEGRIIGGVAAMLDVTELREAQQELQRSWEDLERAQFVGQMGSWRMHVRQNRLIWSDQNHRIFGIPEDAPLSYETFLQTVHPEDRDFVDQRWKAALRGEPYDIEHRILVGGEVKWVREKAYLELDEQGEVTEGFGISQDITERKRSEEALRENEERLRLATRIAGIGTWYLEVESGRFLFSERAREIYGLPLEGEVSVEQVLSTVHPDDRGQLDRIVQEALSGFVEQEDEYRVIHADGSEHWVRVQCQTVAHTVGEPLISVGVVVDITEEKMHEQQLIAINESLEQRVAERTTEVQQQATQLRALASQLSQAEQLERKRLAKILHDHIQQHIVAARLQLKFGSQTKRLELRQPALVKVDEILAEALDVSRSLAVDLSPPILHQAGLIGTLNWLADTMQKKNRFNVNVDADNRAEPDSEEVKFLLFESVRELLLNAMKHAGVDDAEVSLKRTDDDRIELIVSDRGDGFDVNRIENRQSDEVTFGLFSIRERLAHIGGKMTIESTAGKGTRIALSTSVSLPTPSREKQTGKKAARKATKKKQQVPPSQVCRVLVVDDHKILREGMVGMLEMEPDIEIVGQAEDGPQSIGLAWKLKPDVVIMDVNLGDMSGIEATKKILANDSDVQVIGLSMHIDEAVATAMYDAGAVKYLTKTGPCERLVDAIRECKKRG